VQAILASHIDRLAAGEKELHQTLAVLGREFSSTLLKRVIGKSDDALERMPFGIATATSPLGAAPPVYDARLTYRSNAAWRSGGQSR
jgi:hypothetical protein